MKYDNLNKFDLTQLRHECMHQICFALANYSKAAKLDHDDEFFDAKLEDYMTSHRKLGLMIARRLGAFQVDSWHDEFELIHLYNEIEQAADTYDGSEHHDSFEEIPTYLEDIEDPAPKQRVLDRINEMDDSFESQKSHDLDEEFTGLEESLSFNPRIASMRYEHWQYVELEAQAHKHGLKGMLYSKDFWKDFCQRHQYRSELWDKQAA